MPNPSFELTTAADRLQVQTALGIPYCGLPELYGATGEDYALDTAAWQAAIDYVSGRGGGRIIGSLATYRLTNLDVTADNITLDFNGAAVLADPTSSGASGAPMVYARGSAGTARAIVPTTKGAATITATGFGSDFATGDMIVIADNRAVPAWNDEHLAGPTGYVGRSEVNYVKSVAGDVLTLVLPTMFDYDTSQAVRKITPIKGFRVVNFGSLTEADPGAAYPGDFSDPSVTPYLIAVQYGERPVVDNVRAHEWNLHVVNFKYSVDPIATCVRASRPIRASDGGHGYLGRADRCLSATFAKNQSLLARHTVDCTQSRNTLSQANVAYDSVAGAFLTHGLGSEGFHSDGDSVVGGAIGWVAGNPSFAGDYNVRISDPKADGTTNPVIAGYKSKGLTITGQDFRNTGSRGVLVHSGLEDLVIEGGVATPSSGCVNHVLVRSKADMADSYSYPCRNVRLRGVVFETEGGATSQVPAAIAAEGTIGVGDISLSFDDESVVGVWIGGETLTPDVIILDDIRGSGADTVAKFVQQDLTPSGKLSITRLRDSGGSRQVRVTPTTSMELEKNSVGSWSFATSVQTAIDGGARARLNSPAITSGWVDRLLSLMVDALFTKSITVGGEAGTARQIAFATRTAGVSGQYNNASLRWLIRTSSAAEGGGNAGTDFEIVRRDDSGGNLGTPLSIRRSDGQIATSGEVIMTGTYDKPLRLGSVRLWTASGSLYQKSGSDPTTATDGTIIS